MSNPLELEQLRSLLLDDERTRVAELTRRIDQLELHAANTAQVLPDIFQLSYSDPARDRLIESMGPPVMDATAQMASQQTQRTAAALAPVIMPAILAGVAHAIEKLSQKAASGSPFAKMRWRREAERTGIPMALLASRDSSATQVVEAWIFDCQSGELIAHEYPRISPVGTSNPEATAALLTAMRAFSVQHGMSPESGNVQRLDTGERTLWIITDGKIALAADLIGTTANTSEILEAEFQYLHRSQRLGDTQAHMQQWLTRWIGETHARLERQQAGAKWLRWVAIVGCAALLAWGAAAWYAGRVASITAGRLLETPGVATASVDWSWRWLNSATQSWGPHWQASVASDPTVKVVDVITQAYPGLAARFSVRQQKFLSIDRDSIAAHLRESLAGERDLVIQWADKQIKLTGMVSADAMEQLRGWPWALLGLPPPDTTLLMVAPRDSVRSSPVPNRTLPQSEDRK